MTTASSTTDLVTSDSEIQGSLSWGGHSVANQQIQFELNGDTTRTALQSPTPAAALLTSRSA